MTFRVDQPVHVQPRLRNAPRIRQLYWCDFPNDAQLPEMWKKRPVVIISKVVHYNGTATVLPITTKDQTGNPFAFRLQTRMSQRPAWALCDKITSLAVSRFHPNENGDVRMPIDEFNRMLGVLLAYLPQQWAVPDREDDASLTPRSP